jgi:hypothetical protein
MQESLDGLPSSDDRAHDNGEKDDDASQVFHPPQSVGKSLGRFPSGQPESNPQRKARTSIGDIVNRVG